MVIEFARNRVQIVDAQHAEYDPYASRLVVSRLSCSLVGREMLVHLVPNSKVAEAYGEYLVTERYYCNFGVNPDLLTLLRRLGLPS